MKLHQNSTQRHWSKILLKEYVLLFEQKAIVFWHHALTSNLSFVIVNNGTCYVLEYEWLYCLIHEDLQQIQVLIA